MENSRMWRTVLIVGAFGALFSIVLTKQMYTLVHERAVLLEYNDSLVTDDVLFTFSKLNRTSFAFNVTFNLLRDVTDRKVLLTIYVDKMYGTQFKRTGTKITINICKFWERNMFGMKETIRKHGNLEACNIVKGRYYLVNFIPDESMFPRYLPYGSYRIEINVYHESGAQFFKMYWFSRVEQLV